VHYEKLLAMIGYYTTRSSSSKYTGVYIVSCCSGRTHCYDRWFLRIF